MTALPSRQPLPDLLDVTEIADWLKTTPKAIYAMVERAQLPGVVRIGRRASLRRVSAAATSQEHAS